MQAPSVVIAANPYEAELCRRALLETGLRLWVAEEGEGALELVRAERPLALVVGLGLFASDSLALVRAARTEQPSLPIFVLGDRQGLPEEEARGITRLFARPLEVEALADAIERRAVEAELAAEVAEAMAAALPSERDPVVEIEAEYEAAPARRAALRCEPTERVERAAPASVTGLELEPEPPPSEALLRADEALAEAALASLVVAAAEEEGATPVAAARPAEVMAEPRVDRERSALARRLEHELTAAERRLFPNSPSSLGVERGDDEGMLDDLDLDSLGLDTIEAMAPSWSEAIDPSLRRAAAPVLPRPAAPATVAMTPPALPEEEGDLARVDVAQLLATLHAAGYSGAVTLLRGDGDKVLYFDAGVPVSARSSFTHDRLVDFLLREGTLSREQHARVRDLPQRGRALAQELVELGLIKSSELFSILRRHTEEILFSCFGWERGHYRLGREQASPEEWSRLGAHPWALFVEGVRRKYGLERLIERVGPKETVLTPTTLLPRALEEGGFGAAERACARHLDGERTLAELGRMGQAPLAESSLYALAWSLVVLGAARGGLDARPELGVRAAPTLVTAPFQAAERRAEPRPRPGEREIDRAIDRERVLAKLSQVQDGDYFAVLGVSREASGHEVTRAFERLKREFAPERFAEPLTTELSPALAEIGEVLDEAHRLLVDDTRRVAYRERLSVR